MPTRTQTGLSLTCRATDKPSDPKRTRQTPARTTRPTRGEEPGAQWAMALPTAPRPKDRPCHTDHRVRSGRAEGWMTGTSTSAPPHPRSAQPNTKDAMRSVPARAAKPNSCCSPTGNHTPAPARWFRGVSAPTPHHRRLPFQASDRQSQAMAPAPGVATFQRSPPRGGAAADRKDSAQRAQTTPLAVAEGALC